MLRRGIAAAFAAFAFAGAAGAQSFEPFTVRDIRVEGLQRTEPGTVFSYLPVKVGETLDPQKAQAALRALYATGFFSDVRLEHENDVLVVFVQERPAIAQIEEAKAVCRRCEVIDTCLKWAIESGQDAGVWGGMSEDERRALKRRNARARRAG